MKLSNATYDVLKKIAQVWLPALGALYVAMNLIWGGHVFPDADNVSKSVIAVDAFLGVLLGISSSVYNAANPSGPNAPTVIDGTLALVNHPDGGAMVRVTGLDPQALISKPTVVFQVVDQTTPEAPDVATPLSTRVPSEDPPNQTDPRLL